MKRPCPIIFIFLFLVVFCRQAWAQSTNDSLINTASRSLNDGQLTKAIAIYEQLLKQATATKNLVHTGIALNGIGIAHDQEGRFNEALEFYFKAVRAYHQAKDTVREAGTLKNIGNTYRVLKTYDKALAFLHQALAMQTDSFRIPKIINDIGLVYMDQDSIAQARSWFQRALRQYSAHMIDETKAYVYNNLAIIATGQNQYQEALRYYQAALALMQKIQYRYGIALILDNIAGLYSDMKNYRMALEFHNRSIDTIKLIKSNELLLSAYITLAKTLYRQGNYKKAYDYLKEVNKLKDTTYKEESRKNYAEMEAKYQNEKKQTEIVILQQNNRIAQAELSAQRRAKYLLLAVIGLILIITITIYRSYSARKKTNMALNRLNEQLREANRSKTKLISIISHDLRSPVSSLFHFLQLQKAQAYQKKSKQEQEVFSAHISQSAENLLEAMEDLLIWSKTQMDHFTPALETIDASELLDEIIYLHEPFAAGKNILLQKESVASVCFETDPNFVKIILRNLTSNAIKFTPDHGLITLSAVQQDKDILITVKDNGPGIAATDLATIFEWNSIRSDSSGLGLKLAREFTEKLGGNISVLSEPGRGAAFVVRLPLAPAPMAIRLN